MKFVNMRVLLQSISICALWRNPVLYIIGTYLVSTDQSNKKNKTRIKQKQNENRIRYQDRR
jgi:hypothetical protein